MATFDVKESIAGTAGAVCHVYWGHPFDTIKVRLQTGVSSAEHGMMASMSAIARQEGLTGLYQGATPALGSALAEYSVLFTMNDAIRRQTARTLGYADSELPLLWQAIAGGAAGTCAGAAMGPPELIKCRLQAEQAAGAPSRGVVACVLGILRSEGAIGLFRGTTSTMAREAPFNTVLFGAYEAVNSCMAATGVSDAIGTGTQSILSGGIAGMCAWATVLPIDYVKSIVQTSTKAPSPMAVFVDVVRTRGVLHMYAGFGAVSARAFVATAGVFWGYEQTKRLLGI